MHTFPDKDAAEIVTLTFDFSPELGAEAITGTPALACAAVVGPDAGAAAMLNGAPSTSGGTSVLQSLKNGVAGVSYRITCTITTATRTLVLSGLLKIRAAL